MIPPGAAWTVLAQAAPAAPRKLSADDAWWWLLGLTGIVLVAFVVTGIIIYVVRSRALKEETNEADVPLTLHEVREMRARGEIDEKEMEKLKGIVKAQAQKERPKPPPPAEGAK